MVGRKLRLDYPSHGSVPEKEKAAKEERDHTEPAVFEEIEEKGNAGQGDQGNNRDRDVPGTKELAEQISKGERNQEGAVQKTAGG